MCDRYAFFDAQSWLTPRDDVEEAGDEEEEIFLGACSFSLSASDQYGTVERDGEEGEEETPTDEGEERERGARGALARDAMHVTFAVSSTLSDPASVRARFLEVKTTTPATSTMSSRTVSAIDPRRCDTCTTRDCLVGGPRGPGCGLDLLIPKKAGNLDCTFCLDCVTACPHDNVGIVRQVPGADLATADLRSGFGRLARRLDVGVLLAVIAIGGIVNAAGMTAPVVEAMDRITIGPRWLVEGGFVLVAIIAGLLALAVASVGDSGVPRIERLVRAGLAVTPLGTAMWIVHFGFHLVTGWPTAEAALARVGHDLGVTARMPDRILSCCVPPPDWMLPAELLVLSIGLAGSLGVAWWGWRAAAATAGSATSPDVVTRRWLPSAVVLVGLWTVTAWIVFQPMEMRGTSGFMP